MVAWMDKQSKLVKVILALPVIDIVWVIYRIMKSAKKNDGLGIVLGVILIIVGLPFLWLVDIITILLNDRVLWF